METKIINIKEIGNFIKPLDLIIVKGNSIYSGAISAVEKLFLGDGEWTHVGVVIDTTILPIKNGVAGKLYLWQSTLSNKEDGDIESGKGRIGVQISDLTKVIKYYNKGKNQKIAWCKLLSNPLDKKIEETVEEYNKRVIDVKAILLSFYEENESKLYDCNPCALFKSICSCIPNPCGQRTLYFCSELVTKIYQLVGLIDPKLDPETIAPTELVDCDDPLVELPPVLIKN